MREQAIRLGPDTVVTSATSGNAFPRWVLDRMMPIPVPSITYCAELYPITLARLLGRVELIAEPQSLYRRHPGSGYFTTTFDRQLEIGCSVADRLIEAYEQWSQRLGFVPDVAGWRSNSWYHRLRRVITQIEHLVPQVKPFLLIDGAQTGLEPPGDREVIPFPSRDGVWWGAPSDDDSAIAELERHREAGVTHLALVWTAAWYLEQYPRFLAHLRTRYKCVIDDELLIGFDLTRHPSKSTLPTADAPISCAGPSTYVSTTRLTGRV